MTILETTRQIIQKYKLEEKLDLNPFKERRKGQFAIFSEHPKFKDSDEFSERLQAKYESRIPSEWYGLDTYQWPINWLNALEEFLAELEKDSPDFEIFQVKLKLGGSRIYLGNLSEDSKKAVRELENVMCDDNLIY